MLSYGGTNGRTDGTALCGSPVGVAACRARAAAAHWLDGQACLGGWGCVGGANGSRDISRRYVTFGAYCDCNMFIDCRATAVVRAFCCEFLGHLLRDDLTNRVKMSVRPYVRTSTIKLNAATNQIVVFVRVDETFTMI